MNRLTLKRFGLSWVAGLAGMVGMAVTSPALAASLFGVTGDQSLSANPIDPETFFSVSIIDASTAIIQTLGNGNDGESIAFRPSDGLMYHWSGLGDIVTPTQIMETINLNTQAVTNIVEDFTGYDPREVFGSTYDPGLDRFLFTDINDNLGAVTPGGTYSLIGGLETDMRGLAFNGGNLYAGGIFGGDRLFQLNPLTGGTIGTPVSVTLSGFTIKGINGLSTDPDTGILYAILASDSSSGDPQDTGRRLATLNPLTGVATNIGSLPKGFANIEFGPVTGSGVIPEPSTMLLLGSGLAGLVAWRMRKPKV